VTDDITVMALSASLQHNTRMVDAKLH